MKLTKSEPSEQLPNNNENHPPRSENAEQPNFDADINAEQKVGYSISNTDLLIRETRKQSESNRLRF